MSFRRLGIFAFFFIVLTLHASALMVSFLVVETGLNEDAPANQISTIWESGLMAAFFDAGHIVTDSPVVRMEKKPSADFTGKIGNDFDEAAAGGSEYFLLGFLEYKMDGTKTVPVNITLKLYKTGSKELVFEQLFPVGQGKSPADEHQLAQSAGQVIAAHINES